MANNCVCVFVCVCRLQIVNDGNVKLEFSFQVFMEPSNNAVNQNQGGEYLLLDLSMKISISCVCCNLMFPV